MTNGPEHLHAAGGALPSSADSATSAPGELHDPQLERLLQQALRPEDPYTGFADRILSRLADEEPLPAPVSLAAHGKLLRWPGNHLWITGAVAAALIAGLFEGEVALRRAREQQRRIVEATQQFQTTERVTVRALAQAREQLQRAGVPLSLD